MPYAKQNWQNGQVGSTPVSAARLNHIEDGVETATQLAEAGASPEQIETAVNSEIEAQAAAPESALNVAIEAGIEPKADKSGSKTDGQNVKNLRRPTLVIDKMFPNAFHDHQIVQVDEAGMKAWAIGQDRRVRTATWTSQNNAADAFGGVRSSSPDASAWAADGLFMRTSSGALLMEERDLGGFTNVVLLRSTPASDGLAWTPVLTLDINKRFLGPSSVVEDLNTGYLYAAEYTNVVGTSTAIIHRSTDDGVTWTAWKSMPRSETDVAGKIRHWHAAHYDPIEGRVYFAAGDTSADAGIYRVNAAGTDIEPVVLNSDIASPKPGARAIGIMFFPTHIAWGVDGEDPHVRRMARSELGTTSPATERIADLNSTAWHVQNAADDGSAWIVSTATEELSTMSDAVSHLYAVTNNGAQVDEVGAVDISHGALGNGSSLSCLGGNNGGGDVFWLRVHGYQQYPNVTYSAFQMRCRLAWGTSQFIRPDVRPREYVAESRNGSASLAISGTSTFAHTRAPFRTRQLSIKNLGVKRTAGTGTVALQIYNTTTSSVIATFTGQTWRCDNLADTTEYYNRFMITAGNQIEFRLVETGGTATADALGFVEFGWTF